MLLSDYLHIGLKLDNLGVFDPDLEVDSHFFINLQRLKQTKVPEFIHSYEKIQNYFGKIIKLLQASKAQNLSDLFYRNAFKMFDFSEVNGICLGYAKGPAGAGFGRKLREEVIYTAYDIVKHGIIDPEFFELLPLFEKNVGADRLSDMIATLIQEDIEAYTRRINRDLHIDASSYPKCVFQGGLLKNPYKKDNVLLLPVDILQKLPIVRSWEDIDDVISLNEAIRFEMNEAVAKEWGKQTAEMKKAYLKELIFYNPMVFHRVVSAYRRETVEPFTPNLDFGYQLKKLSQLWAMSLQRFEKHGGWCEAQTSKEAALAILGGVKECIENHRGWEGIQSTASGNREKVVQTFIQMAAYMYNKDNYWDISREPDAGRGPVDFKISRGADKTVIEVKLSTNSQYMHGFTTQIQEYAKAEQTENMVYVFIDLGNPKKAERLQQTHDQEFNCGNNPPELIIIDASEKKSASIY